MDSHQHAHQYCGRIRPRWDEPEQVEVWLSGEEEPSRRAFFVGIQRCNESLVCPICAMAHALREAEAIEKAIVKWVEVGGGIVFATFTLQHSWGEPAPRVVRRLRRAWKRMTSSRRWKELVGVHYRGFARGFEMTLGPNGWHPHYHVVFFFHPGTELEVSAEEVFALWADAVAKEGGKAVREAFDWQVYPGGDAAGGGAGAGKEKVDPKRLARYVRKWDPAKEEDEEELPRGGQGVWESLKEREGSRWGLGKEVAGGTVKAKTQGLSPWEILLLAGWEAGVPLTYKAKLGQALQKAQNLGLVDLLEGSGRSWRELWLEYTEAVYRVRPVAWTPGLKGELEALAYFFKKKPPGQRLGILSPAEYGTLWERGETETFLLVVERKGWEKACEFLDMLRLLAFREKRQRPPPPRDPPPRGPEPAEKPQKALVETPEGKWSYVPGEWPCGVPRG